MTELSDLSRSWVSLGFPSILCKRAHVGGGEGGGPEFQPQNLSHAICSEAVSVALSLPESPCPLGPFYKRNWEAKLALRAP